MRDALIVRRGGGKKPVGNVLPQEVLSGKTYSGDSGVNLTGILDIGEGSYISGMGPWIPRLAAEPNIWGSVCYGNGMFVAVASSGTNRVMTSPDGVTWTARSASEANTWYSVCYGT